ncbi:uncharacterized protein F5891DRAFT_1025667 [Suillus fuscotomentosus]|uniref:Uncharacterized protein n=1 Tax=Suillus fuscotomentosus TaxID=1912939 RepID=A0AAD4EC56_9AGAM|nr:uncharacterized protein F5891DRAFT_1025667 [Suillus fuscotomentosus]KAG1902284.1 hypothetical protein F5891DRAFT_1025667 [Suillus fuscotomentosus]
MNARIYFMKPRPDQIVDITFRETYPPRTVQLQKVVNDLHTRDIWTRNILPHFLSNPKPGRIWASILGPCITGGHTPLSVIGLSRHSLLSGMQAGDDLSQLPWVGVIACEHPQAPWPDTNRANCYRRLISICQRKTRDTGEKLDFLISSHGPKFKAFWVNYEGEEVHLEQIGNPYVPKGVRYAPMDVVDDGRFLGFVMRNLKVVSAIHNFLPEAIPSSTLTRGATQAPIK